MKSLSIRNATVVTTDNVLPDCSIRVEGPHITHIEQGRDGREAEEVIDADGSLVLPGIIDLHTDALDAEIVPRSGADIPILIAFRELERKMSGCGITTVFHSLHLGYEKAEEHSYSKYSRRELFEKVHEASLGRTLLNNLIHLRYELSGIRAYPECFEFLEKGYVSMLSVMDHTPGQGQLWSIDQFVRYCKKQGKTEEQAMVELEELKKKPIIAGQELETLLAFAIRLGIPVASHDDDSPAKAAQMHDLGVTICEFPITLETAAEATRLGMHVIGGASNVLRGGSLSGNLNMKEAIQHGVVDTLCSDYYPPSILHSLFILHQDHGLSLPQAVRLATINPARAARIDHHTGSIEEGKDADLIVVRMVDNLPMVTHTMVKGHLVARGSIKTFFPDPAQLLHHHASTHE
jgi:alpha-D-ribose 1-methylphosphonate 5-triphosphate diphosphatase